jgi:hypothetical protein
MLEMLSKERLLCAVHGLQSIKTHPQVHYEISDSFLLLGKISHEHVLIGRRVEVGTAVNRSYKAFSMW